MSPKTADVSGDHHTIAVPLTELADNSCHWPVSGQASIRLFCNASRDGSSHASYCRHHAARSVALDEPRPFVRPRAVAWA